MDNVLDILLDWLTFSSHFMNHYSVIDFLGMSAYKEQFVPCAGRWFYSRGYTYANEITIYMGLQDDCTACCVNISGRGCRDIESFSSRNFYDILKDISDIKQGILTIDSRDENGKRLYPSGLESEPFFQITRVDLACDIISDDVSIQKMIKDTRLGNFTCRSKFYNIMESQDDSIKGYSLYFGKKSSNIFINIYDKRAERGYSPDDMPNWTRVEIRLRHENAEGFLKKHIREHQSLGYVYSGILNNYLRFLKPDKFDTNKSRWKTAAYWKKFLEHSEPVKVFYKPGIEYDYSKFENNFFKQYGSSIVTYLKLNSLADLQQQLELRKIEPNSKQQFLIDNYQEGIDYQII